MGGSTQQKKEGPTLEELNANLQELHQRICYLEEVQLFALNSSLDKRISSTEEKLQEFKEVHSKIQEFEKANLNLFNLIASRDNTSISINLKNNDDLKKIEKDAGCFFVAPQGIEPHLDGYRISLTIGNPFLCNFENVTVKLRWEGNEREIKIPHTLRAGHWNNIVFELDGINERALENMQLSLETPTIQLLEGI